MSLRRPRLVITVCQLYNLRQAEMKRRQHINYADPDWSSLYVNYIPFDKSRINNEIKGQQQALRGFAKPKVDQKLRKISRKDAGILRG